MPQDLLGPVFGNDGQTPIATHSLRRISRVLGNAAFGGRLGDGRLDWGECTCKNNASHSDNHLHDNYRLRLSWRIYTAQALCHVAILRDNRK